MRFALVAISDWWLISSKMAVSTICASISGATTVTTGVLGYITVPLAQRVEVAGEAEMAQVVEEPLVKDALRAQKGYVVLGKVQAADVLHHLRQPREDGEAAVVGVFAVKHVERDTRVAHPVAEIAVGHGQLVKVHHHGKVSLPVLLEHNASPASVSFVRL